jgi:tetratricopeptide (TPR) repeat protein
MKTNHVISFLFTLCCCSFIHAQNLMPDATYRPANMQEAKAGIVEIVSKCNRSAMSGNDKTIFHAYDKDKVRDIQAYDDRIEIKNSKTKENIVFNFHALAEDDISIINDNTYKQLYLKNLTIRVYSDEDLSHLFINFYYIQCQVIKKRMAEILNDFELFAVSYHAQKTKPQITEDQRKYIVQANAATQEKKYDKAIDHYEDVIKISQTSYPTAYYNMALLFAEKKHFQLAILNMKKFLILEPESPDARAAQDKIYEWEDKVL